MVQLGGMTFQPAVRSQRNSHAIVQLSGPKGKMEAAAQVLAFFIFGTDNVYAVISRYTPLSEIDAKLDPYRQFGMVAGCLYYDKLEAPSVVCASDFLTSFAKTPLKLENITQPVVHALPLYKVSRFILVSFLRHYIQIIISFGLAHTLSI